MCIVAFAWQVSPDKPLVLLGNRDELYSRAAAPLSVWHDSPIIAGRDLQSGGSWLGITSTGRWAVITNYRENVTAPVHVISRGSLVVDFLHGSQAPLAFLLSINPVDYAGFNLIVGTRTEAAVLGNRGTLPHMLQPGFYSLSNALLNTAWPKTQRLLRGFESLDLGDEDELIEAGLALLGDETLALDVELPDTGVGYAREKMLSSICIVNPAYGTRVSSVLLLDQNGYTFVEKTLKPIEGGLVRLFGAWCASALV